MLCCRLYYQDSRGLAAMLKELSKSGHGQQALELFDWLQNLTPNHDLAPLADVFSFTTGAACLPSSTCYTCSRPLPDWA